VSRGGRGRQRRIDDAATAIAGAFLAGPWDPPSMGRRAKRAVGDRRHWPTRLAEVVVRGYPEPPRDRPRELAGFVAACTLFRDAADDPDRPLRVAVWATGAPTAMVTRRWGVPAIDDVEAVARWLAVDLDHLAWFADRRRSERTAADVRLVHHHRTWIRKADGSPRLLEAPKRELKDLQRQILHEILDRIPAHDAAHGFRPGRSAATGAVLHTGRAVVIGLDLEAFFTSVRAGRVYGVFRHAGYPEPVAHALAALCTTTTPVRVRAAAPAVRDPDQVARRRRLLDALAGPHLAQGAPTSPALANLVAFGLDRRLAGLAATAGLTYTRYADDLTFSGPGDLRRRAGAVVGLVRRIAADEGFRLHEGKTRVRTASQRQIVTGLVVNRRAQVARSDVDRLRAELHRAATHGPAAVAGAAGHPDLRRHLEGRVAWAGTGNPRRAARLQATLDRIEWPGDVGS